MSRKRIGLAISCLLVISLATYLVLYQSIQSEENSLDTSYTPHPFNDLNWWDLPRELTSSSNLIKHLLEIDTYPYRSHVLSQAGYDAAAEYLESTLLSFSLDTWYEGDHRSLVAFQEGYGADNRAIVFGAYLDTEAGQTRTVQLNAGGCAAVAMIAEILSKFRLPVDVYYCFFSYAKTGDYMPSGDLLPFQYGSKEVSQYLLNSGVDVIAFYNFEGVMYSEDSGIFAEYPIDTGYHSGIYLAEVVDAALRQGGKNILTIQQRDKVISESIIFSEKGIPTINFRGQHINPINPPVDSIYSADYSIDNVASLAQACAEAVIFMSSSGNGEQIHYKHVADIQPRTSSNLWVAISLSQQISVRLSANATQPITLALQRSNLSTIETIQTDALNFSASFSAPSETGVKRIRISNDGNQSVHVVLYLDFENDITGDAVPDSIQYSWPAPIPELDWDEDDLPDVDEVYAGTDIFAADTDRDTMEDGYEVRFGLDPLSDDSLKDLDEDGLSNIREMGLGTFPNSTDTDQDLMDDFWEVTFKTNPLSNDSQLDPDNDTLSNLEEFQHGADPFSQDGDYDGVSDTEEIARGMNALDEDSDSDGLRDQLELIEGLNPLVPDYDLDVAPDGSDRNPRINSLLIIIGLGLIPVGISTIYFSRNLK
ncbi:MAG: hypothetical protein ACFFEA_15015 [Candidatus Thorarchaeota archaeon]